jgi:membrane-bound lytic murein transglycosylase A
MSPAVLAPVPIESLAGWPAASHELALQAFQRSSHEILDGGRAFSRPTQYGGNRSDWLEVCDRALKATAARQFFEANFTALAVSDPGRPEGLFTGYYEPEAPGSQKVDATYRVPVYRKPPELVCFDEAQQQASGLKYGRIENGAPVAFPARREIELGALGGRDLEIAWLGDWTDAFFMQIQGSGRIRLRDGSLLRLAYAGKNGQPYTAVGGVLVDRGVFTKTEMSMQRIRAWMAANPSEARKLMWENRSYVFFREVPLDDPTLGPPGAQKVALTPRCSLAVDSSIWAYGTPVWLDTSKPSGPSSEMEPFRQLMVAQDTGTAIRGYVRGDVFWGAGENAALTAGQMKSPGRMAVLLPKNIANQLLDRQ